MLAGQLLTQDNVIYPLKWRLTKSNNQTRLNLEIWCSNPLEDPRELLRTIPHCESVCNFINEIEFGPMADRQKMFIIDAWSSGALTVIAQLTGIDQKTLYLIERGLIHT